MKNAKMSQRQRIIFLAIIAPVLAVSYVFYDSLQSKKFANWPSDAKVFAQREMQRLMLSHDFSPDMGVWVADKTGDKVYRYSEETTYCKTNFEPSGWKISDSYVTAFFRCDLGDRWADYSVTILRHPYHPWFQTSGQYKIIPKPLDKGPTENIELDMLPSK